MSQIIVCASKSAGELRQQRPLKGPLCVGTYFGSLPVQGPQPGPPQFKLLELVPSTQAQPWNMDGLDRFLDAPSQTHWLAVAASWYAVDSRSRALGSIRGSNVCVSCIPHHTTLKQ